MANLFAQAIDSDDDADRVAKPIRDALGIESDAVSQLLFPQTANMTRERRRRSRPPLLMGP